MALGCAALACLSACAGGDPPLRLSVYATAGDVQRYLAPAAERERALGRLREMRVSRLFLEGRRGGEYVAPEVLAQVRDVCQAEGFAAAGGIATVPGSGFGVRQRGGLDWLDWESERTRQDVAAFFTQNAPLFHELIVDDFFCTGDTSPHAEQLRGSRSWAAYRCDLLTGLVEPLVRQPARAARPDVRLILKFPQWYDRFHLFGYDPPRLAPQFDEIWVGTEVRNPATRRMGYVQPTEGYVNFRWLTAVAGDKVRGAWFDHIECGPQHFLDQAYLSVLAGARELTLFHLGDLVDGHPGDARLAERWPDLCELAAKVRARESERRGIACYKPPGSDGDENLYLMDYLGMLGLPILPAADYPKAARVAFLGAQASADPAVLPRMREHLRTGATLALTPAFLRRAGAEACRWAGVELGPSQPALGDAVRVGKAKETSLESPLELEGSLRAAGCTVIASARRDDRWVPLLTRHAAGGGRVLVLNLRTFTETDFREVGEWLLAPKRRGWSELPARVADPIRAALLAPLGTRLEAPAGVALCCFRDATCLYSFRSQPVDLRLDRRQLRLEPHQCLWLKR